MSEGKPQTGSKTQGTTAPLLKLARMLGRQAAAELMAEIAAPRDRLSFTKDQSDDQ